METFIKSLHSTQISDIYEVGEKNASLGELYNKLAGKGIAIPDGFIINTKAYSYFVAENNLNYKVARLLNGLDTKDFKNLKEIGSAIRTLFINAKIPQQLENRITEAYHNFFGTDGRDVAVRSSVTTINTTRHSFVGLHDSFLNIKGPIALMYAVKCCFASLYTDRAIKYREINGIKHIDVLISVGIQRMVRADLACSGLGTASVPKTEAKNIIEISGTWGLGNYITQGKVNPDQYVVLEPGTGIHGKTIVENHLGNKEKMLVYNENSAGTNSTLDKITPRELRSKFVLENNEVIQLAQWAVLMEELFAKPIDFEWAKDGITQNLYIIQVRPATA